ncbi:hypothetical protein C8J57DRAFT_1713635 [Mycena rebaudengoi]|nr:hypothetical protein C8J57DRAFT_1713635 [Mycena rebaudengoi]
MARMALITAGSSTIFYFATTARWPAPHGANADAAASQSDDEHGYLHGRDAAYEELQILDAENENDFLVGLPLLPAYGVVTRCVALCHSRRTLPSLSTSRATRCRMTSPEERRHPRAPRGFPEPAVVRDSIRRCPPSWMCRLRLWAAQASVCLRRCGLLAADTVSACPLSMPGPRCGWIRPRACAPPETQASSEAWARRRPPSDAACLRSRRGSHAGWIRPEPSDVDFPARPVSDLGMSVVGCMLVGSRRGAPGRFAPELGAP